MSGVVPVVPRFKFTNSSGVPIAGGSVTVYLAGTTALANTYQDQALGTLNTNPVTLDANGECLFWVDPANTYKFLLKDAAGATVSGWPVDNIPGGLSGVTAASFTFLQAGTGAVARTSQNKMRERISLSDFGAVLDGSTNDYAAWTTAVAALSEGDTLYIDGPFYYTTAIVLTKNINVVCMGERGYFKPSVGANDAFTFRPTATRKVSMVLAMYGGASCCTNGIVLDNVTESSFVIAGAMGATSHGIRTLGCLNCHFDFDISTNRSAPSGSGAAMPAKHLYVGASISDPTKPSCNSCFYDVYFGGGGQGIEGADASSQGNSTFRGTIEGNTGAAFAFTGNKGLRISELHLESGVSSASSVTSCADLSIEEVTAWGPAAANNLINVTGCSAFKIDKFSGSLAIDSTSRNGELGVISRQSYDTFSNESNSVHQTGPVNSLGSANNSDGHAGQFTVENIFHNPYVDIWHNGAAAAPAGFSGGGGSATLTWAQETVLTFGGTPGAASRRSAKATFNAQPDLADSAMATPTGAYSYVEEESWYSTMTVVRVPTGQPNLSVYLFDGSAYSLLQTITTKDAWVTVRGSARVSSGNAPKVVYRPAASGHFYIGGVGMVRGVIPPRHICNHGRREEYIVDNVGSAPTFAGQRAYVSGTGKWYLAIGNTASTDWIILN